MGDTGAAPGETPSGGNDEGAPPSSEAPAEGQPEAAEPTVEITPVVEGDEDDEEGQKMFRMDVALSYTKERREIGRPYQHFRGVGPMMMVEKRPDPNNFNFVRLIPEPIGCQTERPYSEHQVVTEKKQYTTTTMLHASGGWPKEINDYDMDAVQRWRKKMLKNEELNTALPKFFELAERCLIQNNSLNIYERHFQPPDWDEPEKFSPPEISLLGHFPDQCKTNIRPVQQVHIEPLDGIHVIGAYAHTTYMKRDYSIETENYIWDITRLPEPVRSIDATVPAVKLQYNPKLPKVVLGGLVTGQLCYWDLRANAKPVAYTELYKSFYDPPSSCLWLHSKSGFDCFASSSDGQVVWYDIRNFSEPTDRLVLDLTAGVNEPSLQNAIGISTLEFEPTIQTKFMIGTETGSVIVGNRKGKTLSEKLSEPFYAFPSPVRALSRNPAYMKCFLCIGDYSFKIMAEDCKESYIFWSNPTKSWLTAGKWSDQRNSTFFTTKADGSLDVWDILMKTDSPTLTEKVSEKPLRCLDVHRNGRLLLVGGDSGAISLYEVSSHFYTQDKNDKSLTIAMFDREAKREKCIDARNREVKLQQRQLQKLSVIIPLSEQIDNVKDKITNDYLKCLEDYDAKQMKKGNEEEDYK